MQLKDISLHDNITVHDLVQRPCTHSTKAINSQYKGLKLTVQQLYTDSTAMRYHK